MRPPFVRVRHVHRPPPHIPVRGGPGEVRYSEVRQDQQEPVESLHAPVQLQYQQIPHGLYQVSCTT